MITLQNVSKNFGKRVLFSDVSLRINAGEKVGLIGPNGAGKTTLFSMIRKKSEISSGSINIQKNIRIGYLSQEAKFSSKCKVLDEVVSGDDLIKKLVREKEKLENKNLAGSDKYGDILHKLEHLGFFDLEYKAEKVLMGLGFKKEELKKPVINLSGGWQMRVLLAKLLVCPYDLLLLDEPTNYLDLEAALWFKEYLSGFNGTFIMISHDKAYLNEVANYTLILQQGKIAKVKGNYQHYIEINRQKRVHLIKQFEAQQKKIKQLETFCQRFHAQPNKASQVRAKRRQLEKMEKIVLPVDRHESIKKFNFPKCIRSGYKVAGLDNISKSYGKLTVYNNFDFEVIRGEKAILVGPNGAGKSTLLKILAGVIDIDKGKRFIGSNVDIGYFSQTRMDVLNKNNTVLEEALSVSTNQVNTEAVRTILGAFLFSGDDVEKKVSVLSGGEKSRLILAKLLVNPPNFLLLDEPTTHLDVDAVDALVKALNEYDGTFVCISHDINFVRSVTNVVYRVSSGNVNKFPGDFNDYLKKFKDGTIDKIYVKIKKGHKIKKKKMKEKEYSEEEKNDINKKLSEKIKNLRKRKENLEVKRYSKERVISNPRHSKTVKKEYQEHLQKINDKISAIDEKINQCKEKFIK